MYMSSFENGAALLQQQQQQQQQQALIGAAAAAGSVPSKGLLLIARSLCLMGDAFGLLGGQHSDGYNTSFATVTGAATAGAAHAASAAVSAAAAVEGMAVPTFGNLPLVSNVLRRLQQSTKHLTEKLLPALQAAAAAAVHSSHVQQPLQPLLQPPQLQQLDRHLQELLRSVTEVQAVGGGSEAADGSKFAAGLPGTITAESSSMTMTPAGSQGCNTKAESDNSSLGSSSVALVVLLPGLGARLVACGEALAALCPVPLCCNNPGCLELRGASELQLVAGKGSVCSRCRWVHGWQRYAVLAPVPAEI
jgi:hypothetical protein